MAKDFRELSLASQAFLMEGKRDQGVALPSTANEYNIGGISGWIPSGITQIDQVLGGGLPLGRISETYSVETSEGKTTLLLQFGIQCQRQGGGVVWMESEAAVDWRRAERMGLDLGRVLTWAPPYLEAGYEWIEDCVLRNIAESPELREKPTLIVWDTISFCDAKVEAEGNIYGEGMMVKPRINKRFLTRINNLLFRYRTHLALISQSIKKPTRFGTGIDTPGGSAIRQRCSIRMELRKVKKVETDETAYKDAGGDRYLGIQVALKTPKNKTAIPYRETELILYGESGYDDILSMMQFFRDHPAHKDMLTEMGGWWYCCADTSTMGKAVGDRVCIAKGRWKDIPEIVASSPEILERWQARIREVWPLPADRTFDPDTGWVRPVDAQGQFVVPALPVFDKKAYAKVGS